MDVNADAGNVGAHVEAGAQRGDAISPVETPRPLDHPGRGSRARHPLSLKNIHHWRPLRRRSGTTEKIGKYFTGFLSVWQSRRRLAGMIGLSKKLDHMPPALDEGDIDKNLAGHLYGERQWTMEHIAEALNVSTRQISKDLELMNLVQNLLAVPGQRDA